MTVENLVAIVVPLVGVLAVGLLVPVFLLSRTERHRQEDNERADRLHREDRDAEWARQDEVAEKAAQAGRDLAAAQQRIADQAAETASLLLARQEQTVKTQQHVARQAAEAAALLLANNERVAATANGIQNQLGEIHTLVNSNMTAEMQARYDGTKRELAVMRELMELKRAGGLQPTPDVLAAIEATETSLNELDAALADRRKVQERVTGPASSSLVRTVTTTTTVQGAGGEA
jgi:hypothetical protein